VRTFKTAVELERWLSRNHQTEKELWLRIHKKGSGLPTVSLPEALDLMLCWGWIDGIRKGFDEQSFLQRYTPRGPRSSWSQINREHVARLTAAGRMTEAGQRQVDLAKADGRWEAAYAPVSEATPGTVPAELRAAIGANRKAAATFARLDKMNFFALAFHLNRLKTPAGRARKIAALVEMLARGEALHPIPAEKKKR
jgi:uncharacterized protein YdeI (YjbR/CyaY-like superfamily)